MQITYECIVTQPYMRYNPQTEKIDYYVPENQVEKTKKTHGTRNVFPIGGTIQATEQEIKESRGCIKAKDEKINQQFQPKQPTPVAAPPRPRATTTGGDK